MPEAWLKRLEQEILILDGAMGTMLQQKGLSSRECPELVNVNQPEWIKEIAAAYAEAGSDIVGTNTFGGSRYKLKKYGLGDRFEELNRVGVAIVKEAVKDKALVAASMGPLGELIKPLGKLEFEEVVEYFAEQAVAFVKGGADLIIIDTMSDLQEARAALLAVKENTELPVICQVTFDNAGRTLTGSDPATVITVLGGMGAEVVGANCSMGPRELVGLVKQMSEVSETPIVIQPNAGIPYLVDGKTVFPATPDEMASFVKQEIDAGANIIGACCGSTPEHIRKISRAAREFAPAIRDIPQVGTVSSRTRTLTFGAGEPILSVGERINPTSRADLQDEIRRKKTTLIRQEALEQAEAGVRVLDVNMGMAGINETAALCRAVETVQAAVDTPLMLDSVDPKALEAALRIYCGKAIINSVNGKEDTRRDIFPLAKKYGAAVVGLTLGKKIPENIEDRLKIAETIIEDAANYGLKSRDLIIDCLVFTAATQPEQAIETLKASQLVKEKYRVSTMLGIGNISHGLPRRRLLNDSYMIMALSYGLDAVFINSRHKLAFDYLAAAEVLTNRDEEAKRYINRLANRSEREVSREVSSLSLADRIERIIRQGDNESGVQVIHEALKKEKPLEILNKYLVPAIGKIGKDYEAGKLFLPQLVSSARTMTICTGILQENLPGKERHCLGRVLLATVENDIHSIGKNICHSLLESNGFEVIDLGESVAKEEILKAAVKKKVNIIGLSALMTTTLPSMEETIKGAIEAGLNIPIVVGGAVVTPEYAKEIGAAGYAKDAVATVTLIKKILSV